MPELARFFGIIIQMKLESGVRHHSPHFHAYYNEHNAVYEISWKTRVVRLAGDMPEKEERLILAWAEIHKTELNNTWDQLLLGTWDKNQKIEPLS